jgi:hypothetical protein
LAAQSTGTLSGTVTDPSGGVVTAAAVICTNTATHESLRTVTNSSGLFRLADVPVGSYEITVSHPGFSKLVRAGLELLTEQTIDLTLVLHLGEASQSVSIDALAPLVQAATSDVQTTVTVRQMSDLPLNGRNAFELAELTPGVIATDAGIGTGNGQQQDNTGLAVNGLRPTENNWQLDGGTYTNRNFGSAPTLPNPDTLQEFTAMTSNFSAENRGGAAVIKLTTRSGTNQFHGSLFEFVRNNILDTRNFFSLDTEIYKQNQFGGTFGGPIRKDRLFFFGSYQHTVKRGSPSPISDTVPSAAQHGGDFSHTGHTIVDPTTGAPIAGNVIPQSRSDPAGAKLLASMPLPNLGANTLITPPPGNSGDDQFMVKMDYVVSGRDHLSGRYFWDRKTFQRDITSLPGYFGADTFRNQTVLVNETHTFGPSWVMENSFNYLQTFRTETANGALKTSDLGVNVPPAQAGVPPSILFTLSGYTRVYSGAFLAYNPAVAEYQGKVSHAAGGHFVRFGGDLRHNHEFATNPSTSANGSWTFSQQRTNLASIANSGDAIASLLLGVPQTFAQAAAPPSQLFVNTLFDLWVQDDWKIRRRLTLNLGLRYDPALPARDADGALPGFVPGAHSTVAPLAPTGLVISGDPGIPAAVIRNHWNTFGPRAGFAWDAAGNGKTIVRAGYGMFQLGSEWFYILRGFANNAPFRGLSISVTSPPSTANPYAGFPGGDPFPFTPLTASQLATYKFPPNLALNAFDPSAHPGYTQSWNFTVERQVRADTSVSVAYLGNHFIGQMSYMSINAAVYGPGATLANEPARFPYQGYGKITIATAYDHGTYESLQATVTKRPRQGVTLLASYTWSKALDLNSSLGNVGDLPRDPYNADLEKGPADFDTAHSAKGAVLYDLPGMRTTSRWAAALVNGWQINSIVTARTGFPFTCRSGVDASLSGLGLDHCDQVLPDVSRLRGQDPLLHWFNQAAFQANGIGTFGQTGRGILRRPGLVNMDISLFKLIPITDRFRAELRVESFNALNHPNFDLFYNTGGYTDTQVVGAANFGQIIHAADPRLIQMALKLRF